MGMLWKVAARNVRRHKRRTIITGIVMMVGIGVFILFDSMLAGMDRLTIDNMVRFTDSFLKVRTPEYVSNLMGNPLDHGVPDPEGTMRAMLASGSGITAVAPRTRFVAQVSNYTDQLPVLAAAVDPVRDPAVFRLPEHLSAGSWLGGGSREVVMGAGLAGELGLAMGDYVVVSATTVYENVNADEYLIKGLLETPIPDINDNGLFMSYADAKDLLGFGELVTEIVSASGEYATLDGMLAASSTAAAGVRSALPGLEASSIGDLAMDYLAMRQMKSKSSMIMILAVLIIAGVGIVNTILMSVYARVKEIGVLKAYGMPPRDIRRLFTLEGLIIGAAGSLAGVLLGAGLTWWVCSTGIDIGSMLGGLDMGAIPLADTLYGEWRPATMVTGFLFGMFVAFVSARIPAKRAARMQVTDALRFV